MPHYRTEKQVPWQAILRVLRWHLKMKMRDYRHSKCLQNGFSEKTIVEAAQNAVMESYQSYHTLRGFLGYHIKTKLEREAMELIRNK